MKTLIISGVPIRTDTNSGKTLQTLFSAFDKNELSQLYFSPETPNIDMCSSYYQMCEKQMIKSGFGILKNKCGGSVKPVLCNNTGLEKNALIWTKNKRSLHMRLIREIIWNLTYWKNNNLKKWLEEQKPDVIFAVMLDTNGATKAINWIAEETGCKIFLYITDDYYYDPESSKNIIRKTYFKKRQKLFKKMSDKIKMLIGCSERITEHFSNVLSVKDVATVYTPSAETYLNMPYKIYNEKSIVKIRYFGNLGLGRWQQLKKLGETIREINSEKPKAMLEVYSSDTDPNTRKELSIENGCVYKGWVQGKEHLDLLQDADIAVHVESFDEHNIRRTWGSISTKIADYLGAGKCILAIGPAEVASITHIKDVSCTVKNLNELKEQLELLIDDVSKRAELQNKARELAKKSHDITKISIELRKIIKI